LPFPDHLQLSTFVMQVAAEKAELEQRVVDLKRQVRLGYSAAGMSSIGSSIVPMLPLFAHQGHLHATWTWPSAGLGLPAPITAHVVAHVAD
jgi:hypothetical protein